MYGYTFSVSKLSCFTRKAYKDIFKKEKNISSRNNEKPTRNNEKSTRNNEKPTRNNEKPFTCNSSSCVCSAILIAKKEVMHEKAKMSLHAWVG